MKLNKSFIITVIFIFLIGCDQNYENKSDELKMKEEELERRELKVMDKESQLSSGQNNTAENNAIDRNSLSPTRTLPQTKSLPSFDQLLDIYLARGTDGQVSRVRKLGFTMSNNLGNYVQVFEDMDGNSLVVNIAGKRVSLSSNYSIDKYEKDIKKNGFVLVEKLSQKNIYGVSNYEKYINLNTQITVNKLGDGDYKNGIRIEGYYPED